MFALTGYVVNRLPAPVLHASSSSPACSNDGGSVPGRVNGSQLAAAVSLSELHVSGALSISGPLGLSWAGGVFSCTLSESEYS